MLISDARYCDRRGDILSYGRLLDREIVATTLAQTYPNRTIQIIVGQPPGAVGDKIGMRYCDGN